MAGRVLDSGGMNFRGADKRAARRGGGRGRRWWRALAWGGVLCGVGLTPRAAGPERPRLLREWRFDAPGETPRFSAEEAGLDFRRGAARLIFRAGDVPPAPASGPPRRLLQAGPWDGPPPAPAFLLALDAPGARLLLLSRRSSGGTRTNLVAVLPPARAGRWREIVLNWRPGRTELIVDGALLKDARNGMFHGTALPVLPAGTACSIGSGPDGRAPAGGRLREAALYSGPLSPLELAFHRETTALNATVETAPPAVTLRWSGLKTGSSAEVFRREAGRTNWTRLGRATRFRWRDADPALRPGRVYEYAVGARRIRVALDAPPRERRGRALLLVERKVARKLRAALARFERDLVGDGWTVTRAEAPRHDDAAWRRGPLNRRYREDVAAVKARILAAHRAAPEGLAAVILVGHVPIPYSGTGAEDGHPRHRGAWPADAWYGDVDGRWSDLTRTPASVRQPVLRNVPGDGKWDANTFAAHIQPANGVEIAVGRIDFARLPALRRSEIELLRAYFAKDHRYRLKQLRFAPVVAAGGFFHTPFSATGRGLYVNALAAASRLFPDGADAALLADVFGRRLNCQWAMQGGYGAPDALHNNAAANRVQGTARCSTAWLAAPEHQPRAGFYLLLGSYFGDWNQTDNNFLRACVALPDSGLAAMWAWRQLWRFEGVGADEPLGRLFRDTARGHASTRTTFLIGDPTLRLQITAPPGPLNARRRNGAVELAWEAAPEPDVRYLVYRWSGNPAEFPERLTAGPMGERRFTDPHPRRAARFYLVRAMAPVTTGSGRFFNLSQAVFAEAR